MIVAVGEMCPWYLRPGFVLDRAALVTEKIDKWQQV
jgi:hypothetical protein